MVTAPSGACLRHTVCRCRRGSSRWAVAAARNHWQCPRGCVSSCMLASARGPWSRRPGSKGCRVTKMPRDMQEVWYVRGLLLRRVLVAGRPDPAVIMKQWRVRRNLAPPGGVRSLEWPRGTARPDGVHRRSSPLPAAGTGRTASLLGAYRAALTGAGKPGWSWGGQVRCGSQDPG